MKDIAYKKILVTHDGSELATYALSHVISLAKEYKSEVVVLQVIKGLAQILIQDVPSPTYLGGNDRMDLANKVQEIEKHSAKHNLEKIGKILEENGVRKVLLELIEGLPGDEIIGFVRQTPVDLIVMSTHGRSGLGRVLLGSVADQVVRNVSCPVMLIRPEKKKKG